MNIVTIWGGFEHNRCINSTFDCLNITSWMAFV